MKMTAVQAVMEEIPAHASGTFYVYNDFMYINKKLIRNKNYLICCHRDCLATATYNKTNKELWLRSEHRHAPDTKKIEILHFKQALRMVACNSDCSGKNRRQLYNEVALRYPEASSKYHFKAAEQMMIRESKRSYGLTKKSDTIKDTCETKLSPEDHNISDICEEEFFNPLVHKQANPEVPSQSDPKDLKSITHEALGSQVVLTPVTLRVHNSSSLSQSSQSPLKTVPIGSKQQNPHKSISVIPLTLHEKEYKMAVVPENFPDEQLSPEVVDKIGAHLMDRIQVLHDGLGPQMKDWRHRSGALLLTCVNQSSKQWLEKCIKSIGTEDGMVLQVGGAEEILNRIANVSTCFGNQSKEKDMDTLLRMLQIQNQGLKASDFRVISTNIEDRGKTAVFRISSKTLELLKQKEFKLFCGYEQISFTHIDNDFS